MSSDKEQRKFGLIDEASTVVEVNRTPGVEKRPADPATARSPIADVLLRATDALPSFEVPPHAGKALESQEEEPTKDDDTAPRIGEYALVARFPSSANAEVFLGYKVTNFGFIRRAVVKWTDKTRPDYDRVRENLLDEGRAISFIDHPNIVTILDMGDDTSGAYIALEYVSGTDMRRVMGELIDRKDRMPPEHACYVVCEVLRGLQHAHSAKGPDNRSLGIVHRDVNPSNVLISEDGHVKLTDFGTVLMKGRMQDTTAPGMVKGKVRYLAPEYIADQICSNRVDVYSAGVMLFEMLTGTAAFTSNSATSSMMMIVREGIPIKDLRALHLASRLTEIVERSTRRDPDQRFGSASDMCDAIEDWMASEGKFTSPSRFSTYLHMHGLFG
jgi:serine/threonine-protein kinase